LGAIFIPERRKAMENKDFQNNVRKLIYEEFQNRLGEQVQLKEDTSQLDEFDYDETRDILFAKLKELSTLMSVQNSTRK